MMNKIKNFNKWNNKEYKKYFKTVKIKEIN